MKLYAMSVAAIRDNEVGIHSAVALLPDETGVEDAGLEVAREAYPESEGWANHYATAVEITQGFPLDPWRLYWEAREG